MSSAIDPENTVAFAGVEGANSDLACRQNYPYMATLALPAFEDVFAAVADGKVKYGMIPIENSHAGRVAEIHHLLPQTELFIVDEYLFPVQHHLFGIKGAKLAGLKQVYSHPQALLQCRDHLRELKLESVAHPDTALAGADIAKWADAAKGAICSELAGALYGLELLQRDMQDAADNRTLFITIAREPADPDPADGTVLTSLIVSFRNIPAALYKGLGGFATNSVNIIKLESYIQPGSNTGAQFFLTVEGHPKEKRVQQSLEELGFFSTHVKLLGVYPADPKRYA